MKIHKAVTPKSHYSNPTLCCAILSDEDARKFSRTKWENVSCKRCLKLRKRPVLCEWCYGTGKIREVDYTETHAQATCGESRTQYKTVKCQRCV